MHRYQAFCRPYNPGEPQCDWDGPPHETDDLTEYDQMASLAQQDADEHNKENLGHEARVVVLKV